MDMDMKDLKKKAGHHFFVMVRIFKRYF